MSFFFYFPLQFHVLPNGIACILQKRFCLVFPAREECQCPSVAGERGTGPGDSELGNGGGNGGKGFFVWELS